MMIKRVASIVLILLMIFGISPTVFAKGDSYTLVGCTDAFIKEQIDSFIASDPQMKDSSYSVGDGSINAQWNGPDDYGNMNQKMNFTCSWSSPEKSTVPGNKITITATGSTSGSTSRDIKGSCTVKVLTGNGNDDNWSELEHKYGEFGADGGNTAAEFTVPNSEYMRITVEYTLGGKLRLGKNYTYRLVEENTSNMTGTEKNNDEITMSLMIGTAKIVRATGETEEIKVGDKISMNVNDKFITGNNTRAVLKYPDGSIFRVKSDTSLTLLTGGVQIICGEVYFSLQKQGKNFQCVTPDSVCGVLGTKFSVLVNQDGKTTVKLAEGSVYVSSTTSNQSIVLKPGESISANDKDLQAVKSIDATALINSWETDFDIEHNNSIYIVIMVCISIVLLVFIVYFILKKKKQNITKGAR